MKNQLIDWSTCKTFKSNKRSGDRRFTIFVYDNLHRKYPLQIQNVTKVSMYELKTSKKRRVKQ